MMFWKGKLIALTLLPATPMLQLVVDRVICEPAHYSCTFAFIWQLGIFVSTKSSWTKAKSNLRSRKLSLKNIFKNMFLHMQLQLKLNGL